MNSLKLISIISSSVWVSEDLSLYRSETLRAYFLVELLWANIDCYVKLSLLTEW